MDDDLKSTSDSLEESSVKATYKPSPVWASKKSHTRVYIAASIAIALVLIGLFIWKLALNKSKDPKSTIDNATSTSTQTIKTDVPNSSLTETHNSTPLTLAFKYPKTWKVTEADNGIRVESPAFSYPAANLGSVDGIFRIYIRQGARKTDGAYIGAGLAIKDSEKLVYTQPAVGQRTDTWLSSFGNTSIDIFSFFLIAGNFQLKSGDTLGPDYGREPDTYIVAGGYTTNSAVDDLAMNSVALDYYNTTNAYKQALQIIASLQLK